MALMKKRNYKPFLSNEVKRRLLIIYILLLRAIWGPGKKNRKIRDVLQRKGKKFEFDCLASPE
ncbi:hypothetical protein [Methanosarcina sp. WWM596]|uniref:hypothetical protein n=1 Tax=Methanosarcina sp. WWM596 TaxID=1434103 RepID=UPI00064FF6BC|nr:hypothetical protein [Methanosarcina sp. WWM596]